MIGAIYKINGSTFKLVKEEYVSSCLGCFFSIEDEDYCHEECAFHLKGGQSLDCGLVDGIYKQIELIKGIKKKINLN